MYTLEIFEGVYNHVLSALIFFLFEETRWQHATGCNYTKILHFLTMLFA